MRSKIGYGVLGVVVAFLLATNPVMVHAATAITSGMIKNETIKSKDIKNNQIKGDDVKDGSLTGADVTDGSIASADVAVNSLTTDDIANGSLGSDDLATQVKGVAMAGVIVNSGGTIAQSFNRVGGAITASNTSTGNYSVTIPGTSFSGFASALASTNGSAFTTCYINQATGSTLDIRCRQTADDALSNTTVTLVLFRDATGPTAGRPSAASADGS